MEIVKNKQLEQQELDQQNNIEQKKSSLKDFEVIRKLGQGSYSSVYKAKRLSDQKFYAMKKIKMHKMSKKEQQNSLNEIRFLASIQHRNIIRYYDAFFDEKSECLFMVMEYLDGGDLFQHALKSLHAMNICHRDIKSANIFLSKDGISAKIGDLNVSKITRSGMCYTQTGTPYYASPEVWRDQPYDLQADIWSLGCIAYEMCMHKTPFRAQGMDNLYKQVQQGEYSRIHDSYSQELQNIIYEMLILDPRKRPSATKILERESVQKRVQFLEEARVLLQQENQDKNEYKQNYDSEFQMEEGNEDLYLLKSIYMPKKLEQLPQILPEPNYNNQIYKKQKNKVFLSKQPSTNSILNSNNKNHFNLLNSKTNNNSNFNSRSNSSNNNNNNRPFQKQQTIQNSIYVKTKDNSIMQSQNSIQQIDIQENNMSNNNSIILKRRQQNSKQKSQSVDHKQLIKQRNHDSAIIINNQSNGNIVINQVSDIKQIDTQGDIQQDGNQSTQQVIIIRKKVSQPNVQSDILSSNEQTKKNIKISNTNNADQSITTKKQQSQQHTQSTVESNYKTDNYNSYQQYQILGQHKKSKSTHKSHAQYSQMDVSQYLQNCDISQMNNSKLNVVQQQNSDQTGRDKLKSSAKHRRSQSHQAQINSRIQKGLPSIQLARQQLKNIYSQNNSNSNSSNHQSSNNQPLMRQNRSISTNRSRISNSTGKKNQIANQSHNNNNQVNQSQISNQSLININSLNLNNMQNSQIVLNNMRKTNLQQNINNNNNNVNKSTINTRRTLNTSINQQQQSNPYIQNNNNIDKGINKKYLLLNSTNNSNQKKKNIGIRSNYRSNLIMKTENIQSQQDKQLSQNKQPQQQQQQNSSNVNSSNLLPGINY